MDISKGLNGALSTLKSAASAVNDAVMDATTSYSASGGNQADANGRRVRLRPKPAAMYQIIGKSPILKPLFSTNGMVWPFQPTINYAQDVSYQEVAMTHTNQEFYAYTRTNAVKLTCDGEFAVQTQTDGLYSLAAIHFLRTVTKMYFGQGENLGLPPPVLLFDAYGTYMFNALPVIVTQFSVGLPKDVDYVPIDLGNLGKNVNPNLLNQMAGNMSNGAVWLPAVFNISVQMTVQNTPAKLRTFNLADFRNGSALKGGGWV